MELESHFSKMQCLFTGHRFSGFSIVKTKINLNYNIISPHLSDFVVIFSADISCLEVDDKVEYQQYVTVRLPKTGFTQPILFDITKQFKGELIKRFTTSNIYKFLELKDEEDVFTDANLNDILNILLTDFFNKER